MQQQYCLSLKEFFRDNIGLSLNNIVIVEKTMVHYNNVSMTIYLSNLYTITSDKHICYCKNNYLDQKNDGHYRDTFLQ